MTMNLQSEKFYGLSWAMLRQVCLSQQETVQRLPGSLYSEGEERKGTPRETGMEWRLRCQVISLSSPGSLEVREVWRAAVAWGLTATGSVLSTASRCWGKVCRECKAGRLSTANGLLNGAVFKTTGCVKTPVWVGRLWSFRVSACSEEPTNLGGHPWLTDTTGVSGAGLQAVTRENQNDTLRWSLKNA